MKTLTLGSLFDGIGVFPIAASRCGIISTWASEIEKAPVSVTKRHFPTMLHLGDITKIDGGKIPSVHIITFGSPCQNLSNTGNTNTKFQYLFLESGQKLERSEGRKKIK